MIATLDSITASPTAKSYNTAYLAGSAYMRDVDTFLLTKSFAEAEKSAQEANGKSAAFFSFAGTSNKHKTNSDIDVKSYTLTGGIAKDHQKENSTLTTSFFLEGGWGNYDTYNSFSGIGAVKGSGDVNHFGVGIMLKNQKKNGFYTEGSLRGGKLWNELKSSSLGTGANFDTSASYISTHLGIGKEKAYGKDSSLDTSLKLLYTRIGNDSVTNNAGEELRFDSANSFRIRLGTRLNKNISQKLSWYAGLAAEYEFAGQQEGQVEGYRINNSEFKQGMSGLIELGLQSKQSDKWIIGLNAIGMAGAREGIGGNVTFSYIF